MLYSVIDCLCFDFWNMVIIKLISLILDFV